ncbi:hypothetical protein ACJD0Z_10115 [Flavobacteriaceae bacterium M23B6Z8]
MKRIQLLTATLLLTGIVAFANQVNTRVLTTKDGFTKRYRHAEPIKFVERGVKFFIFPNGEFDYTFVRPFNRRRGNGNVGFGTPGGRNGYVVNRPYRRAHVRFDRFGRVNRVGNVPVRYDQFGRVFRVGTVFMNYGRRGLLNQVGGLDVRYNKHGRIIRTYGDVHFDDVRYRDNRRQIPYRNTR